MSTFELWLPVKPKHINQPFANDPTYYSKFHDVYGKPLQGHNGIDFQAAHGQPVYAAHDGVAHFERDAHGGEGVFIMTTQPYDYNGAQVYFRSISFHLIGDTDPAYKSPIPLDGSSVMVKTGDLIGYADNTGAPYESAGDHLHFGLVTCNEHGQTMNQGNGFNGCIDPTPYFNGYFAEDVVKVTSIYQQMINLVKGYLTSLGK